MPRACSAATIRGSSVGGMSAYAASREGMTSWWTTPRASDGSSSSRASTASVVAGAYVRIDGLSQHFERMVEIAASVEPTVVVRRDRLHVTSG